MIRISAPGGAWDVADSGNYRVALDGGQVRDTLGNAALTGDLGQFIVSINVVYLPLVRR